MCVNFSNKYLKLSQMFNSTPFQALVLNKNCSLRPQKLCLEYLETEEISHPVKKPIWNIWKQIKRGKAEESELTPSAVSISCEVSCKISTSFNTFHSITSREYSKGEINQSKRENKGRLWPVRRIFTAEILHRRLDMCDMHQDLMGGDCGKK